MLKCGTKILSGKLLTRQVLQLSANQIKWSKSLSTTKLTANHYDNLYADKWAKFQCELNLLSRSNFIPSHKRLCNAFRSVVVSHSCAFLSALFTRESHTTRIQNKPSNICLTIISSVNSEKAAEKCECQGGFRCERARPEWSQYLWFRLRLHVSFLSIIFI